LLPSASAVEGGPGLDGPILADFLAMGAGQMAVPAELSSAGEPSLQKGKAEGSTAQSSAAGDETREAVQEENLPRQLSPAVVRERRLVVAALQRSEALGQALLETPPRAPLDGPSRSPGRLPALFSEGSADYLESCGSSEDADFYYPEDDDPMLAEARTMVSGDASRGTSSSSRDTRSRSLRQLRVLPWHRVALQKMLCRGLLFQFLQDRRAALGLRANEKPLILWEALRAREIANAGEIVSLAKYLAVTELHMLLGTSRQALEPGSRPGPEQTRMLFAERRRVAGRWGMANRALEEDAVVRVFLDGRLSWPRIRELLGLADELEKRVKSKKAAAESKAAASATAAGSAASSASGAALTEGVSSTAQRRASAGDASGASMSPGTAATAAA